MMGYSGQRDAGGRRRAERQPAQAIRLQHVRGGEGRVGKGRQDDHVLGEPQGSPVAPGSPCGHRPGGSSGARGGWLRVHDIIVVRPSGGVCGSSLPEVLEAAAEDAAAQGDDGVGASDGPAHAGALEPCADLLAAGLDDARRDAQALGAELRIAQAVSVPEHIVNAPSRLWRGLGLGAQRGDHGAEPAGIQLGTPVPDPLVGQVCAGAVDGLGHVAQMLLRVVDVDDSMAPGNCSSATRQIQGAPSPMTTPPGRGVEAAPLRLAIGTLGTAAL